MLKKLNGKITKLLFYIKNNFLSCTFKLSVIGTMLILIYLVCILNQPNVARSSDYSDVVRPIENSQKLMMTVSTEIPSNLDSPFTSTAEALTTIDNIIPKKSGYFETHPLFPIQEQTTASMDFDLTTKSALETTAATSVITNPEYTITLENELSIDETKMWQSTTESLREEATTSLKHSEENIENVKEVEPTTSPSLATTTNLPNPTAETTTYSSTPIPLTDISDDLFMDNWSIPDQPLKTEDSQIHLPDESSFQLSDIKATSPESFFLNDDNEFSVTDVPVHVHESEITLNSNEQISTQSSTEEVMQSHEVFRNPKVNKNKMIASETPSMFAPGNFFNLFNTDHISAMSNRKPVWWAKPTNTPDQLPSTTVKGRKRHTNGIHIHPNYESEEAYETPRIFNQMFSRKFKNSVNFLERFFGNLVME